MATQKVGLRDVTETASPRRLRLLAPMRYLTIAAPEKHRYDFVYPLAFGIAAWIGYNLLHPAPSLFGGAGILTSASGLLMMAVPFLIGALASVAMGSPGAYLDRRVVGAGIHLDGRSLSLRQFVCHLLGYLSFLGLVIFLLISVAAFVHPTVADALKDFPVVQDISRQAFAGTMFVLMSAFVVTVFWALYFLTDVVNRQD